MKNIDPMEIVGWSLVFVLMAVCVVIVGFAVKLVFLMF